MSSTPSTGPLRHEHVLDLSTSVAGMYCAKLLGDLGAEVVRIDAPGASGITAEYLYFNTSKRSVVLDLRSADSLPIVHRLLARYDIVIADGPEESLQRRGLGFEQLREHAPALILGAVSGFGSSGPYSNFRTSHLVLCALSSWAETCGDPAGEPLQTGGEMAATVAGAYAAVGVLGAVLGRTAHGHGDFVDVAALEAAITCALSPLIYEYRGDLMSRHLADNSGPSFNVRCKDGFVGVNALTEAQWENMCAFIGRFDFLDDPRLTDASSRTVHAAEIRAAIEEALADRSAEEIFHEAQSWRLPFGTVLSPLQALDLLAHAEREYFVDRDHPEVGPLRTPRVPFLLPASPSLPARAPVVGEHTAEVLAELAADAPASIVTTPRTPARVPAPLTGVRILDFTMFQAGPMATLMASDLGAEVTKVEAVQRLDGWRGVGRGGDRPWDNSGLFNWTNRGKRGITLDLTDPRGAAIARRLADGVDVVVENYTPRVMANFGLDYARLIETNRDLIMLSMPGFGRTTTWRDYAAFAWTTEQMSTICHLTGYEGGDPLFTGTSFGDPLAGLMGAIALLSALRHHGLTGDGQHIDLSQIESATSFVGDVLIEAQLTGEDRPRRGNHHPTMSPHGVFPCDGGRWIAIACADDAEWRALATLAALPLGGDADLERRLAMEAVIHTDLARWTSTRTAIELMDELQAHGITAGVVHDGRTVMEDRHLRARGFYVADDRGEFGIKHQFAEPFRFRDAELPTGGVAPSLGQFNHEVLCDLLQLDDAEYAALERDHVIGTVPYARVPA